MAAKSLQGFRHSGEVDMIDLFMNSAAVESMADELVNAPVKCALMQIGVISLPVHDAAVKGVKVVSESVPENGDSGVLVCSADHCLFG